MIRVCDAFCGMIAARTRSRRAGQGRVRLLKPGVPSIQPGCGAGCEAALMGV